MGKRSGLFGALSLGAVWTAGLLVFSLVPLSSFGEVWRQRIVVFLAWLLGLIVLRLWLRVRWAAWSGGAGSGKEPDPVDLTTGLPNRVSFQEIVREYLDASTGQGEKSLLLLIRVKDLDGISCSYGDEEAERIMVRVSRALLDSLRGADLIGRQGENELIAFLPKATDFSWEAISGRIHLNVAVQGERVEKPYNVTVGIGRCEFDPGSPMAFEALLGAAYEDLGKNLGKEKN